MTPPEDPANGSPAEPAGKPPAVSSLQVLRKRADFLACARAAKAGTDSFLLQGRDRRDGTTTVRVGFTASKKTGNAVMRNRAKRRMRELARAVISLKGRDGWDYVLVARPDATVSRPYADMLDDLNRAMDRVHNPKPGS
ncbi:ribonuclease P protein component [Maritimibacter sp. DP1N21-5]|uniref:ribonuclease P protein component n=1 Tax=Maritimibacter sp. DP1N21-5 TaxID=2836867 RepID=UPI001C497A43|nr:ribonuclease P protein component [Maritimibacter sp. DP1N21-5]MBV7408162.1 ribonuclease P protein component [Maritimibacter sp. DP1N21-5]